MEKSNLTAVEYLAEQLLAKYRLKIDNYQEFEQAKQMEKQQIIDACKKGFGSTAVFRDKLAEQYYNEKYNK